MSKLQIKLYYTKWMKLISMSCFKRLAKNELVKNYKLAFDDIQF